MRSIWMSRLGRASTIAAIAGLAMIAGGASGAEARDYGYWDGYGYHRYYSHPSWSRQYYYGYAPRYSYYAPRYGYYAPPAVAYAPEPYYYGPSVNFTIPLR